MASRIGSQLAIRLGMVACRTSLLPHPPPDRRLAGPQVGHVRGMVTGPSWRGDRRPGRLESLCRGRASSPAGSNPYLRPLAPLARAGRRGGESGGRTQPMLGRGRTETSSPDPQETPRSNAGAPSMICWNMASDCQCRSTDSPPSAASPTSPGSTTSRPTTRESFRPLDERASDRLDRCANEAACSGSGANQGCRV